MSGGISAVTPAQVHKNPKSQIFQKYLGTCDLPGFLDYWIIITTKSSRPHHIDHAYFLVTFLFFHKSPKIK